MSRILLVYICFTLILGSCTQRLICPAYQSAFIYDKETLRKKFSYMQEDSTPRIFTASSSKNKYLVAVPESYRKKLRALQTVEMKPIYPVIPDSLKIDEEADLLLAERDITDSTDASSSQGLDPEDSTYVISKAKEKFNVEQDNYMWYFRDVLVLPDVRAAMSSKNKETAESAPVRKKAKKGLTGFFKNLFGKNKNDSTAMSAPTQSSGSDSTAVDTQNKGVKKKKTKTEEVKKKEDAKKEEDDGF